MKRSRNRPKGQEKPGLIGEVGSIRDLSAHLEDILGDTLIPGGPIIGEVMCLGIEGPGEQAQGEQAQKVVGA